MCPQTRLLLHLQGAAWLRKGATTTTTLLAGRVAGLGLVRRCYAPQTNAELLPKARVEAYAAAMRSAKRLPG